MSVVVITGGNDRLSRGPHGPPVPAPRAHGEAITRRFYSGLLTAHPELLNDFNPIMPHVSWTATVI